MKYIQTYERYNFIDLLELQEFEKGIEFIENTYERLNIEETFDCLVDLEELIPKFGIGHLSPYLLRPSIGLQNLRCLGQTKETKFLRAADYFAKKQNIHGSNQYGQYITSALVGLSMKHQDLEWGNALGTEAVSNYFKNKIKEESEEFKSQIEDGWIPCFAIHQKLNLNVVSDDRVITILDDIRKRLEGYLDKTIIFLPPQSEFTILIIDNKYLSRYN
jgi:hypothetical protein